MKFFLLLSMVCAFFAYAQNASAQTNPARTPDEAEQIAAIEARYPAESIAAIIDDKVVTTFDVRQRMMLMLISAGGRIPEEALPQLQQQALRDLIEEQLKLKEAAKFELEIQDKDIDSEIALMAAQSRLTPDQLAGELKRAGIELGTLREQIRATIAWPELVQGRYRSRVRVNEDEIEDTLDRMKEDASKEQYLVSEICIPLDDPARAQEYYQAGLQLIEQMRRGVPFSVVAQQFSACTSAAVGGDMGWVRTGELPPELDNAIRDLPTGAVTNPVPSEGAFVILAVRDRREAVIAGEATFKLAYVGVDKALGKEAAKRVAAELSGADACSGRALRIDLGAGVGYSLLENVTVGEIDETFRETIEDLVRGDTSPVIEKDGIYHAAYVCDKDEGLGLPSRETLENRIFSRQLSRIGQQYLRDIERESLVEVRLKDQLQLGG
ncbi:MAG: peptidylprolyl isomerase [Pseudomonadota bacterium]